MLICSRGLQFTMDANVGASAGRNASASLEATTASLTAPRSSYDTFSYTVSKGVMLDISWKGPTLLLLPLSFV